MEQQYDIICPHDEGEEQHICLEKSCLENSEFKLDCFACLQKLHKHTDCLKHVDDILTEAEKNKQAIQDIINRQLQFCKTITLELALEQQEMEIKLKEWINIQFEQQFEDIKKYQNSLSEQKLFFEQAHITRETLQISIDFTLYNSKQYLKENKIFQNMLQKNKSSFRKLFDLTIQSYENHYLLDKQSAEIPKIVKKFRKSKLPFYERCTSAWCNNQEKMMFCLAESCLLLQMSELQCPNCQTKEHCANNTYDTHEEFFINYENLQKDQSKKIQELKKQFNDKQKTIEDMSLQLQEKLFEFQTFTVKKFIQFKKFIIDREKEIISQLQILISKYKKHEFKIYTMLFIKDNQAISADVCNMEASFIEMKNKVGRIYEKEQQLLFEQQLQQSWFNGLFSLNENNHSTVNQPVNNKVSMYIQELLKKIQQIDQQKMQLQQQQLDQGIEGRNLIQQGFEKISQELRSISESNRESYQKILLIDISTQDFIKFFEGHMKNKDCSVQ